MSLILEALKKSEEKRRLGQAPGLNTPFGSARQRPSLLPFLVVAIALALGVGWWLSRGPAAPVAANGTPPAEKTAKPAAREGVATAPAAMPTPPPQSTAADRAPTSNPGAPPAIAIAPTLAQALPPNQSTVAAPQPARPMAREAAGQPAVPVGNSGQDALAAEAAAAAPQGGDAFGPATGSAPVNQIVQRSRERRARASASPATPPAPARPVVQPAIVDVGSAMPPPTPPPAPQAAISAPPVAANDTNAASSTTPKNAANEVDLPPGTLPLYYQLPYAVRKDIPQLKLSMHVYSPDPAQRFVVINGTRLSEGDALGTDVNLREVRPTDIVLEYRGQKFSVPRSGF
jgi:general secretion pathway protein B